jgi:hypothetical protein
MIIGRSLGCSQFNPRNSEVSSIFSRENRKKKSLAAHRRWSRSIDCCDVLQLRPCWRFQQKDRHFHRMPHLLDCLSEENILEKAVAVGGHGNQVNPALS